VIRVYGVGEDGLKAFTDFGIVPHRARSDVRRKSDLAQALAARINQSACGISPMRTTGPSAAIIWLGRLALDCSSVAVILDG
jgi:hypothetical protein